MSSERQPSNLQFARLLLARRGCWRTDLAVRIYGWAVVQHALQMQNVGFANYLRSIPLEYHLFAACGVLCLLLGARLALLIATLVCFGWFLSTVVGGTLFDRRISGDFLDMIADEFLIYAAIPALAIASFALCAWRSGTRPRGREANVSFDVAFDENLMASYRILALTTLAFAALHKLNADFFDPAVSCLSLHGRLARWWDTPLSGVLDQVTAFHIVAGEALVPVLLLVSPLVGALYTVGLLQAFAHIGPTAFAAMLFATLVAFLSPDDDRLLRSFLRRAWPGLAVGALLLAALSHGAYRGDAPWLAFYTFEATSLGFAACLAALLWSRLRARSPRGSGLLGSAGGALFGSAARGALRPFLVAVLLLALANGMTPYLGSKFRLAQAMLSNLRVDTARWNHFFVPAWLRLGDHDPFVHVERLVVTGLDGRVRRPSRRPGSAERRLTAGLFAPYAFARRAREHRLRGDDLDISLRYRGEPHRFRHATTDADFWRFVEELPAKRLFQARLTLAKPQDCVH